VFLAELLRVAPGSITSGPAHAAAKVPKETDELEQHGTYTYLDRDPDVSFNDLNEQLRTGGLAQQSELGQGY